MNPLKPNPPTFQELILRLQAFWAERGCVLQQPYDLEVGAGTMNPFYGEILKAIESELDRSQHTFILSNHYDSVEKQRTFIETLLQLGGDGVIMSPAIGTPPEDIQLAEENGMNGVVTQSVARRQLNKHLSSRTK